MKTKGFRDERAGDDYEVEGLRAVALGEMARGRRRLGELTPEQERALESLLVSVADHIYGLVSVATGGRVER